MIFLKKKIFIIGIIGLLLDRASKIIISKKLLLHKSITLIPRVLYITYEKNDGAAWSILSGNRLLLIIVSFIVLVAFIYYLIKEKNINVIESISYAFILSGIVGNLIDRICYGYVIDFINVYIFEYDFPIFNIADVLIVMGTIIYVITCIKRGDKIENSN